MRIDWKERDAFEAQELLEKFIRNWKNPEPCKHDSCHECQGKGIRKNGQTCVHMISCPCPRCTPRYM